MTDLPLRVSYCAKAEHSLGRLLGASVGFSTGVLLQAARANRDTRLSVATTVRFFTRNIPVLSVGAEHDSTRSP